MNYRELVAEDEAASAAKFALLEAHDDTRGAMIIEYDDLDLRAIGLAEKARVLQMAVSLRANDALAELIIARRERDEVKRFWHQRHSWLEADLERTNAPYIMRFHESAMRQVAELQSRAEIKIDRDLVDGHGYAHREIRHNFAAIREAQNRILATLKKVKAAHLRPLAEINRMIRVSQEELENIELDFQRAVVGEDKLTEMNSLAYQPHQSEITHYRAGFGERGEK